MTTAFAEVIVENMKIRLNVVRRTSLELAAAANLDGDLCVAQKWRVQRLWLAVIIPQRNSKGQLYLQPLMKELERARLCTNPSAVTVLMRSAHYRCSDCSTLFDMEQMMMMMRCS